jgi:tetratricopeptide (TPR) repeat protein
MKREARLVVSPNKQIFMPSNQQLPAPSLAGVQVELLWARHRKKIIWGAILVLFTLICAGAYLGYQSVRNAKAARAFGGAHDIKGWQSVIKRYPGTTAAGNAALRIAATEADSGQYDNSDKTYQGFLHDYPNHPLRVNALFGMATNAEAEGKFDDALRYYSEISNRYSASYLAPMALYNQGLVAENRGNLKEALQNFEDTIQRYPQSIVASEAAQDAGRLTAKLGLNAPGSQGSPGTKPASSPAAQPAQGKAQGASTPAGAVRPKSSLEP